MENEQNGAVAEEAFQAKMALLQTSEGINDATAADSAMVVVVRVCSVQGQPLRVWCAVLGLTSTWSAYRLDGSRTCAGMHCPLLCQPSHCFFDRLVGWLVGRLAALFAGEPSGAPRASVREDTSPRLHPEGRGTQFPGRCL